MLCYLPRGIRYIQGKLREIHEVCQLKREQWNYWITGKPVMKLSRKSNYRFLDLKVTVKTSEVIYERSGILLRNSKDSRYTQNHGQESGDSFVRSLETVMVNGEDYGKVK